MHSLNELREWFMSGHGVDGTDINTSVTLTFADGQTVEGDLSIGWFDDDDGAFNHIGMELWAKSPALDEDDRDTGVKLDVLASRTGAWSLDEVVRVFNINPDARIWNRESGDTE